MTGLPTDAAGLAVFVIDILIQTMSVDEAVQRLSTGLAAKAQAEGRDLSDDELALDRALADEAERRRRGQTV
jgi:hypothetical protein